VNMRLVLVTATRDKLEEARYFLQRMRETQSSPNYHYFRYELHAFLSAARSITNLPAKRDKKDIWYMEKEFGHRPDYWTWYDEKVQEYATDKSMQFINDERAIAVHFNKQSLHTHADAKVSFTEYLNVSDSFTITSTNIEDGTTETFESPPTPPVPERPTETSFERTWYFDIDILAGNKEVISVCEAHFRKLENLVEECEKRFP
jgi:hypothetical protein